MADLAGRFNLDADALKAAVDCYNELCGEGADSDFGKAAGLMVPIETPPFYLAKLSYNYFFSVGGITTDGRHRVLDGAATLSRVSMPSATTAICCTATCTPSTCRASRSAIK